MSVRLSTQWSRRRSPRKRRQSHDTGQVKLLQYICVSDAGMAINPIQAEGQGEGAAMQGIGHALFEALIYEGGQLLNGNLVDYRVPSFQDLPEYFRSLLV